MITICILEIDKLKPREAKWVVWDRSMNQGRSGVKGVDNGLPILGISYRRVYIFIL